MSEKQEPHILLDLPEDVRADAVLVLAIESFLRGEPVCVVCGTDAQADLAAVDCLAALRTIDAVATFAERRIVAMRGDGEVKFVSLAGGIEAIAGLSAKVLVADTALDETMTLRDAAELLFAVRCCTAHAAAARPQHLASVRTTSAHAVGHPPAGARIPGVSRALELLLEEQDDHSIELFAFEHLPEHLRVVSRRFGELAQALMAMPVHPERTAALRSLLVAKDAAVRVAVAEHKARAR